MSVYLYIFHSRSFQVEVIAPDLHVKERRLGRRLE